MTSNIVVGSLSSTNLSQPTRYRIPLVFSNVDKQIEVTATIGNVTIVLGFNLNIIVNSLFMSAYTLHKTKTYFKGYACVFSNYINKIDNGCPYKFYFLDQSNGQQYAANSQDITYESLSNGVNLYAELR